MAVLLAEDEVAYAARINGSHDYRIEVDVLDTEERVLVSAKLLDGQVNFQRESTVRRTATLTLLDPSHALGLDTGDITAGALFADRMIRVRHVVEVDGKDVAPTVIVGPVSQVSRTGAVIEVEVQDKTALAMLGSKPFTVPKGMNAAGAIYSILNNCTGEQHFRLIETAYRLPVSMSVGWADEASPWSVVTRIAAMAGLRVYYSCDGYVTLEPRTSTVVWTFNAANITSEVTAAVDLSDLVNYARVTSSDEANTVLRGAAPPADHPLSPQSLGRHGVNRYMPALAEVDGPGAKPVRPKAKKGRQLPYKVRKGFIDDMTEWRADVRSVQEMAQRSANSLLTAGLGVTSEVTFSAIPVFHLDAGDMVRVVTEAGPRVLRLEQASIPLTSGDMTVGFYRRVSRPPRGRAA